MSIQSEITRIRGNVAAAYAAAESQGATMPATQSSDNLAATVSSISSGSGSSGRINPNLLDNWFWQYPINQYFGNYYGGGAYTISTHQASFVFDRWSMASGSLFEVVPGEGVEFKLYNDGIYQYLDSYVCDLAYGQEVTVSAWSVAGWCGSATFTLDISDPQRSEPLCDPDSGAYVGVTCQVANGFLGFIRPVAAETTPPVSAVKLELGAAQTLAIKEGDSWILRELPNRGEQLARCQKYYVPLLTAADTGADICLVWKDGNSLVGFVHVANPLAIPDDGEEWSIVNEMDLIVLNVYGCGANSGSFAIEHEDAFSICSPSRAQLLRGEIPITIDLELTGIDPDDVPEDAPYIFTVDNANGSVGGTYGFSCEKLFDQS